MVFSPLGSGLVLVLMLALVGCGAKSGLDEREPARFDSSSPDAAADAAVDAPLVRPFLCRLPPTRPCALDIELEGWDLDATEGRGSDSLHSIEALQDGRILVEWPRLLLRIGDAGESWEELEPPPFGGPSYFHMWAGPSPGEVYAAVDDVVARSADGGDTWDSIPKERGGSLPHLLPDGRWLLGGDNRFGVMEVPLGPIRFVDVPVLDTDADGVWDNNSIFGFAWTGEWFVAVERFGRVARARDLEGPWLATDEPLYGSPELLFVEEFDVLLARTTSHLALSCDQGESFASLSELPSFGEDNAYATQLALTPDGVLVTPSNDAILLSCDFGQSWSSIVPDSSERPFAFDVALHPDGSVWVAGRPNWLWRLRW